MVPESVFDTDLHVYLQQSKCEQKERVMQPAEWASLCSQHACYKQGPEVTG